MRAINILDIVSSSTVMDDHDPTKLQFIPIHLTIYHGQWCFFLHTFYLFFPLF